MRDESRRFLRDLGLLLGLPGVGIAVLVAWWHPWPRHYDVPAGTDIFTVATGQWDWADADSSCVKNPHTISFSPDHRVMTLRYLQPITDSAGVLHWAWEYDIQEVSRHHVRGRIRGEDRKASTGEPVGWDLVLRSPDAYYWHRTDWPFVGATKLVRRCLPVLDEQRLERGTSGRPIR
jgi:hypothetical protein